MNMYIYKYVVLEGAWRVTRPMAALSPCAVTLNTAR